jgi:hypothetical protein
MRLRLGMAGLAAAATSLLSGCGPDWTPAKAMVTSIDRKCDIIEIERRSVDDPRASGHKLDAEEQRSYTGQCSDVAEWDEVRAKRSKKVSGEATVNVMYTRADGQTGTGALHFDGRDDEFYSLHVDDSLDVLVDPGDPEHLRKV